MTFYDKRIHYTMSFLQDKKLLGNDKIDYSSTKSFIIKKVKYNFYCKKNLETTFIYIFFRAT